LPTNWSFSDTAIWLSDGISAADAPPAYILQLALYRELLRQIYPGKRVDCCLLWTRSGRLMPVEDGLMDRALAELTLS